MIGAPHNQLPGPAGCQGGPLHCLTSPPQIESETSGAPGSGPAVAISNDNALAAAATVTVRAELPAQISVTAGAGRKHSRHAADRWLVIARQQLTLAAWGRAVFALDLTPNARAYLRSHRWPATQVTVLPAAATTARSR